MLIKISNTFLFYFRSANEIIFVIRMHFLELIMDIIDIFINELNPFALLKIYLPIKGITSDVSGMFSAILKLKTE